MKPRDAVQVVRMWCGERTNTVVRCFVNPEELSCEDLLVGIVSELTSCLMV
jgi:hypothetical protein